MSQEKAIEMFVGGLVLDPNTQAPVVVLKDESGDLCLPIWIGIAEATSIASAIKQVNMARPLTHDLMFSIFGELDVRVQRIVITELKEQTYYAELIISAGDKVLILDSRPSDAIALAVRAAAPIFVVQHVLDQAKVSFQGIIPDPSAVGADPSAGEGAEGGEGEGEEEKPTNFADISKDQWNKLLDELDPDDFKYKM